MAFAKQSMTVAGLLLAWGLCVLSSASFAADVSNGKSLLEQRAHDFLKAHARELGRVDSIIFHHSTARLPACEDPQPFLTTPEQRVYGRVAIGIRCGPQGNQVRYLQADVSVLVDHVVTARDIDAGETVGTGDLELAEAPLERLPRHALLSLEDAIGLLAARPLHAGTTLQAHHLRREKLVKRGEMVTITARGTGFSVRREAKALDNGSLGERVRLRTENGEQLEARVVGRGQLEISF